MEIVNFVKSFPLQSFSKGEVLLPADVPTEKVFIIRDGVVKTTSASESGEERLLRISGRYDMVPTEDILKPVAVPRYFYTAFSDGSAYVVEKKLLLEKAASDVVIMSQIANGLSEHHDDSLRHLESIEQPNLRMKIIHVLQALSEKFSGADIVGLHEVGLNLTHQDIADMVHATRESVSIELKQLQDEGYIDYSRSSFTVHTEKIANEIIEPA